MGFCASTRSGQLWQLNPGAPNPQASIASYGRLIMTNYLPGRLAFAAARGPIHQRVAYNVRSDGTLWEGGAAFSLQPGGAWNRVGTRSDWVATWGGNAGTGFGFTADGTIWTWGVDLSQKPLMPFSTRLKLLQDQIGRVFNPSAAGSGAGPMPVFQDEPRPLMRLVMPDTNRSATLVNVGDPAPERH